MWLNVVDAFWCLLDFLDTHDGAVTAVATIFIAVFTIVLTCLGRLANRHFRTTERAYVIMSHKTPANRGTPNALHQIGDRAIVTIEVQNYGRTPAYVIGGRIKLERLGKEQPLPEMPDYRGEGSQEITTAYFLVATQTFQIEIDDLPFPISYATAINNGNDILRLYGYVDYADKFGQIHRAQYARRYVPGRPGNNLAFVTEPGYNDDRPLSRCERRQLKTKQKEN